MSDEEQVELHRDSKGRLKGDETPPQNGIILAAAVMSVVTLFGLKYVFDSYLDSSNIHIRREHIAESHSSEVLAEYRAHAADQLQGGQMPIGEAIEQLATRGRSGFPVIRPVADTNMGPREGWAAMPVVAPEPAPHAQAEIEPTPIDTTVVPPVEPMIEAPIP